MECKICGEEKQNAKGLSYHVKIIHKIDYYDYLKEHEGLKPNKCNTCGNEYEFDRKKHRSITRYFEYQYCNHKCQKKNEDLRKMYSAGGVKGGHATKGRKQSKEEREMRSIKTSEAILKGFKYFRGKYKSVKTDKIHSFRSSWEHKYMYYLDTNPDVIYWNYEPFMIEYEYEGDNKRYLIDFEVYYKDGEKELIEVGVSGLKNDNRSLAKFTSAEKYCEEKNYSFRLVTEKDFEFMEIS